MEVDEQGPNSLKQHEHRQQSATQQQRALSLQYPTAVEFGALVLLCPQQGTVYPAA